MGEIKKKQLQMANGILVPLQAAWKGVMQLGGIEVKGSFEVFDSGGNWVFFLGKPLLQKFNAKQNFSSDTVAIRTAPGTEPITLYNEIKQPVLRDEMVGMNLTLDVKQAMTEGSNSSQQSVLTRGMDPRKLERVVRILKEVMIGCNIKDAEQNMVVKLMIHVIFSGRKRCGVEIRMGRKKVRMFPVTDKGLASTYVLCHPSPMCP